MTQTPEGFDYSPNRFNPEFWGYHTLDDKCSRPIPVVNDDPTIRSYARKKLAAYLSPQAERANPQPLKDSEPFDPAVLEPGTVVEFNRERFKSDPDQQNSRWKEPYTNSHVWGVVCKLPATEGTVHAIMPFIDFPAPGSDVLEPSAIIDGPIRHGAVYHTGSAERPSLTRITVIKVHPNIF